MNSPAVILSCLIIGTQLRLSVHAIYPDIKMQCYDCNSRGIYNPEPNKLCPANGTITGRFAEYLDDECPGFCMLSIRQNFLGDVIRGCYTIYPRVPWYTIPRDECIMFEGNMYCHCIGHRCNNWNMEQRVKDFVRRYGKRRG